jgi:hypothetical protein
LTTIKRPPDGVPDRQPEAVAQGRATRPPADGRGERAAADGGPAGVLSPTALSLRHIQALELDEVDARKGIKEYSLTNRCVATARRFSELEALRPARRAHGEQAHQQ